MSYIDRINVQGTEYDVLDRRVRLADGQDFDYGTLVQGGINNTNGYTTGAVLRRSETYCPVIEGPVNIVMSNGLTGYIRLYDANKNMLDPDSTLSGADTTNHRLVIGNSATLTVTMKEYNPNTAYFRFYFSCGTEDNIGALVRENARIIPLQTVATSGDMQMLDDDVSDLKSAINMISQIVYDENLVNNALTQEGQIKYNTGEVQTATGFYCTDYVQVFQGVTYLFRGVKSRFAFYDESKTYYPNSVNDITTFNGGTIRGFSDNFNCLYFVAPIDGFVRVTTNLTVGEYTGKIWMCAIRALTDDTSGVDLTKPNVYAPPVEPKTNTDVRYLMSKSRPVIDIKAADGIDSYYQKMLDAFTVGNCDVYIGTGTYTYTNALIEQIRAANKRGVPIGNGCRYFFAGAKIICEYTGSNAADVVEYFSPLDSQNVGGDYEIYNLDLVAKNVCYALHDEANGADTFCKHMYKDCYLELDNTALGVEGGNSISKALGGGLGKFEEVIIENCVFKATNPAITSSVQDDASYHSASRSPVTDAKIVVSGCWFQNRFRTSDLTNVTTEAPYPRIIFTGNSSGVNVNIPLTWTKYAWNNETRV